MLQVVENRVLPDLFGEYVDAAQEFARDASENDAGCQGMRVLCDPSDHDCVWIVSIWEDMAAMEEGKAFPRHKAKLKPAFLGNKTSVWKLLD